MAKKRAPRWTDPPFDQFRKRIGELADVVHISVRGIRAVHQMPAVVEAAAAYDKLRQKSRDPNADAEAAEEISQAKIVGALATRELKRGFPMLYGQATVSLWALLEDFSRSLLATWLRRRPTARRIPIVQNIKIRLVEFNDLTSEERYEHIVSVLETTIKAGRKMPLGRFEQILDIFDLAGSIDLQTRRDLYELSCFRHALAHGRTHVDRKLSRECRWLRLQVGKPIAISQDQFVNYYAAVLEYALSVWGQVLSIYGIHRKPSIRKNVKRTPS